MPDDLHDERRRELSRFCDRYIFFWMVCAVVAFSFLGWGAILAWVGVAVAMYALRDAFLDGGR